jgi:hypothetical protein
MDANSNIYPSSKYFQSKDDCLAFRQTWKNAIKNGAHPQAYHFLVYAIVTGHDWRKAFPLPTSKNKLNNGYTPEVTRAARQIWRWARLDSQGRNSSTQTNEAVFKAAFSPIFGESLTYDMLQKVSEEVSPLSDLHGDVVGMGKIRQIYAATAQKVEA